MACHKKGLQRVLLSLRLWTGIVALFFLFGSIKAVSLIGPKPIVMGLIGGLLFIIALFGK